MNDAPARPSSFTPNSSGDGSAPSNPTDEVVKSAPKKIVTVTDATNRMLTVKFLSPLDRMRLAKVVGADASKNEVYLGYAALAYAVTHIDDELVTTNNVREIEFLVERLGEDGLEAVGKCYQENFADFLRGPKVDDAKN